MDTNLTTSLILEATSNITTALISAGVSVIMTIIYWCGKGMVNWYQKRKTFKTYKKYVQEFFKLYLIALDTNTITFENINYNITDDLEFIFIIESGNKQENISKHEIPTLILGFISERELLSDNETKLLLILLKKLSSEKWIEHCKKIDENKIKILFSQLEILSSEGYTSLVNLNKDQYIYSPSIYSPSFKDTIEKLQTQFKHNEFDKRIRRIIKKSSHLLS